MVPLFVLLPESLLEVLPEEPFELPFELLEPLPELFSEPFEVGGVLELPFPFPLSPLLLPLLPEAESELPSCLDELDEEEAGVVFFLA